MLRINILIALVVVLLLGLNVDAYADQATIDKIEAAYARANAALEELANTTEGYDRNLAGYRLSMVYNLNLTEKQADETIQQVVDRLREHLKAQPDDAEDWALMSGSHGLVPASPSRDMTHEPMASQTLSVTNGYREKADEIKWTLPL